MKPFLLLCFFVLFFHTPSVIAADETYMPFILGSHNPGNLANATQKAKTALTANGFEIVGEVTPYAGTNLLVVSSKELRAITTRSEQGAFGAVQRVAVVADGDQIQVSYTNPVYMQYAYHLEGDLAPLAAQLGKALGKLKEFGVEKALTAKQLRTYHYMFGRPYFEDVDELASYPSHAEALAAVEASLAAKKGGCSKVFQLPIEGVEQVLFGVTLSKKEGSDAFIMSEIDFKPLKSAAHLPYEILVIGNKVIALPADYRIAINFPELSMMGSNSFMNIMSAPGDIKDALTAVANYRSL